MLRVSKTVFGMRCPGLVLHRHYSTYPQDNNPYIVKPKIPEYFIVYSQLTPRVFPGRYSRYDFRLQEFKEQIEASSATEIEVAEEEAIIEYGGQGKKSLLAKKKRRRRKSGSLTISARNK